MSHFDGMSGKTNVKYLGSRIVPQLPECLCLKVQKEGTRSSIDCKLKM